ncbi:unnamed protein product [Orchesella dallaii]|uniref:Odorant receptor n=1 Tax=Orchesella dallaii TaxID=48710 RepID=A0ABP1QFV2_9HEXA
MGFGEAYINVQLFCQKLFDIPITYDITQNRVIPNPKLKSRMKMPIWHITNLAVIICYLYQIYHGIKMTVAKNSGRNVEPEEAVLTCFSIAMLSQSLITMYTLELNPDDFAYMLTQIFRIDEVKYRGLPSSKRLPDLQEVMGYGMFIGFCNFTISCILYPLLRDYDPINMELNGFVPEIVRRILAMMYYGPMCFYTTNYCAQFILLILATCQIFEKKTELNMKTSKGILLNHEMNWLEKLVRFEMEMLFKTLDKFSRNRKIEDGIETIENEPPTIGPVLAGGGIFEKHRKFHNCLYIMMAQSNVLVRVFIPAMAGVGMAFCVACNYVCLKMYDNDEVIIFVVCAFGVIICVYALILFLCAHASLPLMYTEETIHYWKGELFRKIQRKQCKAMISFGFTLGPFFMAKKRTALDMMDTILNYTITILLA